MSLMEVNEASLLIQEAAHEDANIIFGAVVDPKLEGRVKVTVIATGFELVAASPAGARRSQTPWICSTTPSHLKEQPGGAGCTDPAMDAEPSVDCEAAGARSGACRPRRYPRGDSWRTSSADMDRRGILDLEALCRRSTCRRSFRSRARVTRW